MLRGSRWTCGLPDGWMSPRARSMTFGISSLTTNCEASMKPGVPGWMRSLPDCVKSSGSQPTSSSEPEQITRSAERMRAMRLGRASMRWGSCAGETAEVTATLSPPSSWARAAHSGSQANTLRAAAAGNEKRTGIKNERVLKSVFMFVASELVGAVRAQTDDVLEEDLIVG